LIDIFEYRIKISYLPYLFVTYVFEVVPFLIYVIVAIPDGDCFITGGKLVLKKDAVELVGPVTAAHPCDFVVCDEVLK
jgi:hypothetical protein